MAALGNASRPIAGQICCAAGIDGGSIGCDRCRWLALDIAVAMISGIPGATPPPGG
jgi:hypothetical protein